MFCGSRNVGGQNLLSKKNDKKTENKFFPPFKILAKIVTIIGCDIIVNWSERSACASGAI